MSDSSRRRILDAVGEAYSEASRNPQDKHAFPVGRAFAGSLGYPLDLLVRIPPASVEAFSGVSSVSVFAQIPRGAHYWTFVVAPGSTHSSPP